MLPIKPLTRRAFVAVAPGIVICVPLPEAAAENKDHNDSQRRISIAMPDFSDNSASDIVNSRDLTQAIISKLKQSSQLVFVEPDKSIEENIDIIPKFEKWRSVGTDCLVTGRITRKPDQRILVDFRLWDVLTGQQIVGVQYQLQSDDWRQVAHAIAEAILERLVGRT
jgi:TolB protein